MESFGHSFRGSQQDLMKEGDGSTEQVVSSMSSNTILISWLRWVFDAARELCVHGLSLVAK